MLPSPATTFWSDSAALSEVFLPLHARASIAASNSLPSGSGPSARNSGSRSSSARGTSFIMPKRRGAKRSRHAEMHHQHVAGGQVGEQIFGAAAEPLDPLAFEPGDEVLRQRPAQVAAVRDHLGETRAFHHRRKSAAHGLDFGQFGHG